VSQGGWDRLRRTRLAFSAVVAAAAGVFVWAMPGAVRFMAHAPGGFWAMALAALVVDIPLFGMAGREDFRIRSTLSVCFTFAIFVLWGAATAIVVQAVAGAVSVAGQRYQPSAGLFFVSRLVLGAAAAEVVVNASGLRPMTAQGAGLTGADLLSFTLLALVWLAVSYAILAVARSTVTPRGLWQAVTDMRFDLISTTSSILVVAPFLTTIGGWWSLLVAVPLILWNQLTREQLRHEQQLSREPVSGLLNRQGLAAGMRSITATDLITPQGPRPFGIILVDVESVLDINRTLGRDLYEKVIGVAARRLIDAYGDDLAARLSGEGIVMLVPDLTEENALAETQTALSLLEPLVEADNIPFALDPAAGVALSPQHGRDLGTLLMRAELAAGDARRTGRRAALYLPRAAELAERRITLLRELHSVFQDPARHREITVLYQPQVDLDTGRLAAVEALVRWTHPQWGPIPTDELIEAIEPSEIMHMLTWHVLETVAAQVRRWHDQGDQFRVSVNVSVQDLHKPDFIDQLGELVRRHGIAPRRFIIEITERMFISDPERVREVAGRLAGQGVGLSLDDFGTGHASLQQLRELPLTEVKVDKAYVGNMVDNPADEAIVTSVHLLTRALGVDVVAEGVEDQRTADALAKLPGVIGQGWHFGRPMTVDDFQGWRQHGQRRRVSRVR
jgi:diguanylate cyclase (GGDEF)-like protein